MSTFSKQTTGDRYRRLYKKIYFIKIIIMLTLLTHPEKADCHWSTLQQGNNQSNRNLTNYLEFLSEVNASSLLEGAGCHGSLGYDIGFIGQKAYIPDESQTIKNYFYIQGDREQNEPIIIPKIIFLKGLPWPIDLGVNYGHVQGGKISQWSAHVQWSVYEDFQMPALALRANFSKMSGIKDTEFDSRGASIYGSYSFLRYFTVFGGLGMEYHQAEIHSLGKNDAVYFMISKNDDIIRKTWINTSEYFGARILIIPPTLSIAIEAQTRVNESKIFLGKISFTL
ncbi:MAG: hypothetical protein HQK54_03240 [Oligoflexales bacterium]|nr:hypothetical protein [Oligoflexales bacterium]